MSGRFRVFAFGAMLAAASCAAQQPDASLMERLVSLTQRAGVVFAGEVTAIRRGPGIVEIDFRVDQPLKSAAGTYTLREWGGLWAAGQRRYWAGERAVFFLHAPSGSGLGAPVDGMDGVLPLVPPADAASTTLAVDVRRLRARVQREVGQPMAAGPESLPLETVSTVVAAQIPAALNPVRPRPVVPTLPPIGRGSKNLEIVRQLDAPQ